MASAIVRGGLAAGVVDARALAIVEPDASKRAAFEALGVRTFPDAAGICGAGGWLADVEPTPGAGQVLLAVKPQSAWAVAAEVRSAFARNRRVVISILAGTHSARLRELLGEAAAVVRVMPNTPARVGRGMSGVALGAGAATGDEAFAVRLFGGVGDVVRIDEELMDAFTAVAGSGPAYVFALAEGMVRGAVEAGFDRELALRIVRGTVAGAGELLARAPESPGALREAVTSKGGTTAAALEVFSSADLVGTVARAILAARDRGRELGEAGA